MMLCHLLGLLGLVSTTILFVIAMESVMAYFYRKADAARAIRNRLDQSEGKIVLMAEAINRHEQLQSASTLRINALIGRVESLAFIVKGKKQ